MGKSSLCEFSSYKLFVTQWQTLIPNFDLTLPTYLSKFYQIKICASKWKLQIKNHPTTKEEILVYVFTNYFPSNWKMETSSSQPPNLVQELSLLLCCML